MPSASMRDPKTSFGKWFEQVKAKEERGLGSGNAGGGNGDGGSSGFLGKLKFWGQSPNAAAGEPDVERGGLLPSFMRSAPAESSSEWCDCGLSATQRFQIFVVCILGGASLMALAVFVFLPMVLLVPAKFAMTFTLGSGLFQTAFAMLRGPAKHLRGLFAKDRLGGTLVYLFSCGFTLYAAIIARSYVLVITAVCLQVGSLVWSSVSYLPRGQAALKVFTKLFMRVVWLFCYPCTQFIKSRFSS